MMTVHCIIHRENLAVATLSPESDKSLIKVIKVINYIYKISLSERLFKKFCEETNEEYDRQTDKFILSEIITHYEGNT